jgi:phospholipase C
MIPSSACQSWQPDQSGLAGERGDHAAEATPRAGTRSFGVHEPNITPWRRAVCGDLAGVFDFTRRDVEPASLPDASWLPARARAQARHSPPAPPSAGHALPAQERGDRPTRPLPYALEASGHVVEGAFELTIANNGASGAAFVLYPGDASQGGPWFYAVEAGKSLTDRVPVDAGSLHAGGSCRFGLYGPNGFYRGFEQGVAEPIEVTSRSGAGTLELTIRNLTTATLTAFLDHGYAGGSSGRVPLAPGETSTEIWDITATHNWYSFTVHVPGAARFARTFAGHLENGRPSRSDPLLIPPSAEPLPVLG